jgi:hypothetical protein
MFRFLSSAPPPPPPAEEGHKRPNESGRLKLVHTQNVNNESSALYNSFSLSNYNWRLGGSSWVTETRTFYLLTELGEMIFMQLAFTDSGWPIPPSCQVTARYFDTRQASTPVEKTGWVTIPKYKPRHFGRNKERPEHVFECINHSASEMKSSKNKTSVRMANGEISIIGPSTNSEHRIDPKPESKAGEHAANGNGSKSDALKVSYHGASLSLDFQFEPQCSGIAFGDGKITFGEDEADGEIHMRFLPCGVARGNMTIAGESRAINAVGLGVHQFQGIRPNLVAARWHLAVFISDKDDAGEQTIAFMIQVSTPATYGSTIVNLGGVYGDGRLLALCREGKITSSSPNLEPHSGYYIPRHVRFEWRGVTIDNDPFYANCSVTPGILCERINLLDQLPFVMRKIVETFVTKPYVYQWVDRAEFSVNFGGNEGSISGWLFTELSILGED